MDDLERELRVWLKAGMPDYPSLAAIFRVKFAEKDAELANRHAEVERLRGLLTAAHASYHALQTDTGNALAVNGAELAEVKAALHKSHERRDAAAAEIADLTAELTLLRAEHAP
jgi:hypothetical protein